MTTVHIVSRPSEQVENMQVSDLSALINLGSPSAGWKLPSHLAAGIPEGRHISLSSWTVVGTKENWVQLQNHIDLVTHTSLSLTCHKSWMFSNLTPWEVLHGQKNKTHAPLQDVRLLKLWRLIGYNIHFYVHVDPLMFVWEALVFLKLCFNFLNRWRLTSLVA